MTCEQRKEINFGFSEICGGNIEVKAQFMTGDGGEVQVQQCEKCKNVEIAP